MERGLIFTLQNNHFTMSIVAIILYLIYTIAAIFLFWIWYQNYNKPLHLISQSSIKTQGQVIDLQEVGEDNDQLLTISFLTSLNNKVVKQYNIPFPQKHDYCKLNQTVPIIYAENQPEIFVIDDSLENFTKENSRMFKMIIFTIIVLFTFGTILLYFLDAL